jgi:hypothetical protein
MGHPISSRQITLFPFLKVSLIVSNIGPLTAQIVGSALFDLPGHRPYNILLGIPTPTSVNVFKSSDSAPDVPVPLLAASDQRGLSLPLYAVCRPFLWVGTTSKEFAILCEIP